MLENKFKMLCQNFSHNEKLINTLWQEIKSQHSEKSRHYHTLSHLASIYKELEHINLSPLFQFAIFYHDIVYEVSNKNNEEQSALLAQKRLAQLGVPEELNKKVFQLIVETKTHQASSTENELFLDADLSILGANEKCYKQYISNVRKEYTIYDDTSYFTGRKKVLKMFLEKDKMYSTQYFHEKYEKKARVNMLIEYNSII